ncbi:hypothetical protein K7432_009135 [Basidiobolus ranarum]|uniref:G-protein coupled receptors family 2 profile 2 domain-containing protein n=1 Tax=Basidiobolus ranarum TaxID=34480 RepID=A0ABR2WQP9_9FUNG
MSSADVINDVSPEQIVIKSLVSEIMSVLSLLGACFIVITIIFTRIYKPHIANRVSISLTLWKAFADLAYSIIYLISQKSSMNLATCKFVLWGYVEFTLLSIFLTCTIAFNIQAIFVSELSQIFFIQRFYLPVSLVVSLTISLIPLLADQFTYDPLVGNCWYRDQYTTPTMIWEMCTYYGWIFLGIVYCSIVVILVTIRLIRNERQFRQNISPTTTKLHRNINKIVGRIILYPIIPIIAQSFNFITEIVTFYSRRLTFSLYLLSAVGPASIGFLNFLVFLFDPAFQKLVKELRYGASSTSNPTDHHDMDLKSTEIFGSSFHIHSLSKDGGSFGNGNNVKIQTNSTVDAIKLQNLTNGHRRQDTTASECDSTPLSPANQNPFSGQNSSLELILDSSESSAVITHSNNNLPSYQAPEGGSRFNIVKYM